MKQRSFGVWSLSRKVDHFLYSWLRLCPLLFYLIYVSLSMSTLIMKKLETKRSCFPTVRGLLLCFCRAIGVLCEADLTDTLHFGERCEADTEAQT